MTSPRTWRSALLAALLAFSVAMPVSEQEAKEIIHVALMRAMNHWYPGERHAPLKFKPDIEVVDSLTNDEGIEIYGEAFDDSMKVKINRQKLTTPNNLENLVYHEYAHLMDGERGHGERWAELYMSQVQKWMPKEAKLRLSHLEAQYGDQPALREALDTGRELSDPTEGRHSSGGLVVDEQIRQQVREQLEEIGVHPEDIESYLETPSEAPAEVQEVIRAVMLNSGQDVIGPGSADDVNADGSPRYLSPDQFDIAQKIAAGEELSPEEQEILGESGSVAEAIGQFAMELAGEKQINYDWVYSGNIQLDMGSLDSVEALISLADHLEEVAGIELDRTKSNEDLALDIKQILARGGANVAVQASVMQWARETQNYLTPHEQTYVSLLNKEDLTPARAKTLMSVGNQFNLDAEELYQIWSNSSRPEEELAKIGTAGPRPFSARKSFFEMARDYKQGLDMYDGSQVLAGVYANDPELAAKLRDDPYSLDSGEIRRALDYLGQGPKAGQEGTASGNPQLDWLKQRLAGGHRAVAEDNSEAVKEAVNTLAQQWNLVGAEGVAVEVAKDVVANAVARARASLPNPFGPIQGPVDVVDGAQIEARIRQGLRGTGEYQELFGQKQAGESEEEYVSRFERRSQSQLGDDNVGVVRNAMRSGDVNTVYRQGLYTDVGESSTRFQEILARNASVFREML